MASGKPPRQWYTEWLETLRIIHSVIDPHIPDYVRCVHKLQQDLAVMLEQGYKPRYIAPAHKYADSLEYIGGTAYVLVGAHLFGGELMRRRLEGYPTSHLTWDDRSKALEWFKPIRQQEDLAEDAVQCFKVLLECMDFIGD